MILDTLTSLGHVMVLGGKIENNSSRLGVLFEIQSTEKKDKLTKIFSLFLEVQPSLIT